MTSTIRTSLSRSETGGGGGDRVISRVLGRVIGRAIGRAIGRDISGMRYDDGYPSSNRRSVVAPAFLRGSPSPGETRVTRESEVTFA